jgi:hypothetical protein
VSYRTILAAAAAAAVVAASSAPLSAQGTAVSLRGGTLGPSLGVTTFVSPKFNVRLDVPYFSYDRNQVERIDDFDLDMDMSIRLFSVSGLVDYHPFGSGFRLTGGAVYNRNEGTLAGRSAKPHTVGQTTYSVEQIGELSGVIEMGSAIAPYLGLGYGNPVALGKGLGFALDLGVMFSGSPKVSMTGTGMVAPTAEESAKIQENMEWLKYYPGISLGLTYKIF